MSFTIRIRDKTTQGKIIFRAEKQTDDTVNIKAAAVETPGFKTFTADTPREAFEQALAHKDDGLKEPLIEWNGTEELCVVEVDWKGANQRDMPERKDSIINSDFPVPIVRHFRSHGGGLKIITERRGVLTAQEVAALVRMVLREKGLSFGGTIDKLQSSLRHPGYPNMRGGVEVRCGTVFYGGSRDPDAAKRALLNRYADQDINEDARDEWLQENGLVIGMRFPHDRCPIDPTHVSTSQDVVVVYEYGIKCWSCDGRGVAHPRMRKPGYVHFCALLDGRGDILPSPLCLAVKNHVHWEQAQYDVPYKDKEGYRALLKLWHLKGDAADKERLKLIDGVFVDRDFVRGDKLWLHADTLAPWTGKGMDKKLPLLPAVRWVEVVEVPAKIKKQLVGGKVIEHEIAPATVKAKVEENRDRLGTFEGAGDLSKHGYRSIFPIRGADLAEHVRPERSDRIYVIPPKGSSAKCDRGDIKRAEEGILKCWPTVNLDALRLIIAAVGVVQRGNILDIPQIFIKGQSKSGKTIHAHLAAQILGCGIMNIRPTLDKERFKQAYAMASDTCGIALINEFSKNGVPEDVVHSFCLMFEKGTTYHRMHVGPCTIDNPAVVVITDPEVPKSLKEDYQTARRIAVVDLGAGLHNRPDVDWQKTCGADGVSNWRESGDHAELCDVFLADIRDRFFAQGTSHTFKDIVEMLGQGRRDGPALLENFAKEEVDPQYLEMWEEYRKASVVPNWRGVQNARVADVFASRLGEIVRELAPNGNYDKIKAKPWGTLTGLRGLECRTIKLHGTKLGMKFVLRGSDVDPATIDPASYKPASGERPTGHVYRPATADDLERASINGFCNINGRAHVYLDAAEPGKEYEKNVRGQWIEVEPSPVEPSPVEPSPVEPSPAFADLPSSLLDGFAGTE
jgi:hypothetical protein